MISQELFSQYTSKLIECLMHLRIDIIREQTLHFQKIISRHKNSLPLANTLQQFLSLVVTHDLYGVSSKLKSTLPLSIKVTFHFVKKGTQLTQLAESWYFQFKELENRTMVEEEQKAIQEVEMCFQELITLLIRLPLWEKFWGNVDRRKEIKKDYTLTYKIEYNKPPSNHIFEYNKKVQKVLIALNIQTEVVLEYREDFWTLFDCKGLAEMEKTVIIKPHEALNRKKSLYQFYDEQLDITFVSSDSELNPYSRNTKQMKVVGVIEEESDDEYVIIIDEEVDHQLMDFKEQLRLFGDRLDMAHDKDL